MRIRREHVVMVVALALGSMGLVGCQGEEESNAALLAPEQTLSGKLDGMSGHMPMFRRLSRRLDLTDAQKSQVREILQRERNAMIASGVREKGHEAMREAMKERHERVAAEISGLLTAEQRVRFEAMRQNFHARAAGGFGHGELLGKELGLSPEQQLQVKSLMEQKREAHTALRTRIRAGEATREEMRELRRAEREKFRTEVSAILTPEQRARFEELIKEREKDMPR